MKTKYTIYAALIIISMGLVFIRIRTLHETLRSPDTLNPVDQQKTEVPEDAALFNALWKTGLMTADDNDRLNVKPSDYILALEAQRTASEQSENMDSKTLKQKARILKKLYTSNPGKFVQNQIRLWNQTRFLAAVRDNRPRAKPTDRSNAWRCGDPQDIHWNLIRTGNLVPEWYGYVNNGRLRPHFNNWRAVYADKGAVVFQTTVTVDPPIALNVHVIGKAVPKTPSPQKAVYLDADGPTPGNAIGQASACQLTYKLTKDRTLISIQVTPIKGEYLSIEGLCIRKIEKDPSDGEAPSFAWVNLRPRSQTVHRRFKIATADRVALTNADGDPTPETQNIGLLPLVGMGRQTPMALYDVLSRSGLPAGVSTIKLTIDAEIQKTARAILFQKIKSYWSKTGRDPYENDRRACVVILDASTGAILAAAQHPIPPPDVHPWDIASFRKIYHQKDPMLMRAWQGLDKHNAPGSTFKTVTALAGLQQGAHQDVLKKFIHGYTQRNFLRNTGLTLNCGHYDPYTRKCYAPRQKGVNTIANFTTGRGYTLKMSDYLAHTPAFGLVGAIQQSANIWFVRLAQLMDGPDARSFETAFRADANAPLPSFHLAQTAQKLGFGQPMPLAANLTPTVQLFSCLPKKGRQGGIIYGQTSFLNITQKKHAHRMLWVLSQNAIGQGVTAAPLQMAKVAATISTGEIIQPYLIGALDETTFDPPPNKPLEIETRLLRKGMKQVVDKGTAAKYIKRNKPKFWAKTGTANVARDKATEPKVYYSAWLMGWYEAKNGKKYAFCCMATHAWGPKKTGGAVCGPIMDAIMAALDR